MKIESIPISKLKASPYNPRVDLKKGDEAYTKIERSISEFGMVEPIVWNRVTGHIVGGHQRFKILKEQGAKEIEVSVVEISDPAKEKTLNIALNKVSGDWDMTLLKDLLIELEAADVDLNLTGFDDHEWKNIMDFEGGTELEEEREMVNLFSVDQIREKVIENWDEYMPKDKVKGIITPHMAMAQFNRLASGYKDGYHISLLFNPHRLSTPTKRNKKTLLNGLDGDQGFVRNTGRFVSEFCPSIHYSDFVSRAAIGIGGIQTCFEFQPKIARDLYLKYAPKGGNILDPCHGWGGRVIGWLSTNLKGKYYGYDPFKKTNEGVKNLIKYLRQSKTISDAEVFNLPYEKATIKKGFYDYALTSPPYFDTEIYSPDIGDGSAARLPSYGMYVEKFLKVLIEKTMNGLKPGAYFTVNIGINKYPIKKDVLEIVKQLGLEYVQEDSYFIGGIGIRSGTFDEESGIKGEPFITIKNKIQR